MNRLIEKFCLAIKEPRRVMYHLLYKNAELFKDDLTYLKLIYYSRFGKKLDLNSPVTFSEKLQWLKLYDRRPEYVRMVDKIEAKKFAAEKIGEQHIIPTIAEYDGVEDIEWDALPNQFVLKCTHDSGGVVVCPDKSKLDIKEACMKLDKGLRTDYYMKNREWPYKQVRHRIICEEYLTDESGYELKDYKWFCFNGIPEFMFIASDRNTPGVETRFDFYDMDFNHLPFTNGHPNANRPLERPAGFEEMKRLAAQLSAGIPHVRVDFYDVMGKVYFGEMTFFHWSGLIPFKPEEWDYRFGEKIILPVSGRSEI